MTKSGPLLLAYCHLIFVVEILFYKRRIARTDASSTFREYCYKTILLIYNYCKTCLFIKSEKRKFIRQIVGRYCSVPSSDIKFVANYGVSEKYITKVETSNALCFGLHDNCAYEQALCDSFGMNVIACDPTPISQAIFGNTDQYSFNYLPVAIATETGDIDFFLNDEDDNSGGSIVNNKGNHTKTLTVQGFTYVDLLSYLNMECAEILKMDIDGGEQDILLELMDGAELARLPRQIALEIDVDLELDKIVKLSSFLDKMKSLYKIYFIPHKLRYSGLELLFVIR